MGIFRFVKYKIRRYNGIKFCARNSMYQLDRVSKHLFILPPTVAKPDEFSNRTPILLASVCNVFKPKNVSGFKY